MSQTTAPAERSHWQTLRSLVPWLWPKGEAGLRVRVVVSVMFLVAAKAANVLVPLAYARAVDALAPASGAGALVAVPVALVIGYGLLRAGQQRLRRAAQRGLRQGAGAGRPADRAVGLPPPACAVACASTWTGRPAACPA